MLPLVLLATSAAGRHFPVPLEFPSTAAAPTFPLLCEWLQRVSHQLDPNATSMAAGRQAVLRALGSLDATLLAFLQIDQLAQAISENVTRTRCDFNASLAPLQWHAWKAAMDAPVAAPHNHKLVLENAELRILNVYAPANTREQFHNHRRYSFFVYYGISMGMIDFGPDGE
eukprot:5028720-Prymnesium_polylepis.1